LATHPHFLALEKQSAGAWQARLLHSNGQHRVVGAGVQRHIHDLDVVQVVRVQLLLARQKGQVRGHREAGFALESL
jgi:hypothetical protein